MSVGRISSFVPPTIYAANIFDQAGTHKKDIRFLIEGAQRLDYAVGYWWLSQ